MAEERELTLHLNGVASGYNMKCPRCVVDVRYSLPPKYRPEATVRSTKKCWKCDSKFTVRYSLNSAEPDCGTRTGKDGHAWPLRLKVQALCDWVNKPGSEPQQPTGGVDEEEVTRLANAAVERGVAAVRTQVEQFKSVLEVTVRQAEARAKKRLDEAEPVRIAIHVNGQVKLEVDKQARHKAYDEVMDKLLSNGKVMLVGPPGSGKSSLARQIAEDLGYGFTFISCTEGISEGHILGRLTADGRYVPSAFVQAFEGSGPYSEAHFPGMVHLWDEYDAMDANTGLSVNEALSNGHLAIPSRPDQPYALIRKNMLQVAAANTWSTGAQVEFAGRNAQDNAAVDRFVSLKVWVDYDVDRERRIAEAAGIQGLAEALWQVRRNVSEHGLRRPVSTRAFIHSAKLRKYASARWSEARLLASFFEGWPTAEKVKAIDGVTLGHQEPGSGGR